MNEPCDPDENPCQAYRALNAGAIGAMRATQCEVDRLKGDLARDRALMADPHAVHVNLLRGTIAKPTRDQILHVYPEIRDEIERLKAERLVLDQRIHNQRKALRENWMITEMRAEARRAWYPSKLLMSLLRRARS